MPTTAQARGYTASKDQLLTRNRPADLVATFARVTRVNVTFDHAAGFDVTFARVTRVNVTFDHAAGFDVTFARRP